MKALILVAAVLLSGCTTYETTLIKRRGDLRRDATAYITIPADSRFENEPYPGSGRKVAVVVQQAFSRHTRGAEMAVESAPFERNIEAARAGRFDYLVTPAIVHWEERATEWSGSPDRIEIELRVFDVATGATVEHATMRGKSKWFTFGGDHAEDLLDNPINAFVDSLFPVALK